MHEIGSHIPALADRYPWISPSCEFDIAATGRKNNVILYLNLPFRVLLSSYIFVAINYT